MATQNALVRLVLPGSPTAFQQLWDYNSPAWAGKFLDEWCRQTLRSRIEPMKKIARSAVMTTNTTQLTIDLATLIRKRATAEELAKARKRASATFPVVFGFIAGCAAGALLYARIGFSALALPLILAIVAIPLGEGWS